MPTMDQVVWASVNVSTGGDTKPYPRGALLPSPAGDAEVNERSLLRLGGAIRTVEVVYTPEELAQATVARGTQAAADAASLDVDPAAPSGQQEAGQADPGPPTLPAHGTSPPVVIGGEDLTASLAGDQAKAAPKRTPAKVPAGKAETGG